MRIIAIVLSLTLANVALGQDMPLSQVLIDGEGWKETKVSDVVALTARGDGTLIGARSEKDTVHWIDPKGIWTEISVGCGPVGSMCVSREGALVLSVPKDKAIYQFQNKPEALPGRGSLNVRDVAVSPSGKVYYVDPKAKGVFLVGNKEPVATDIGEPSGLAFWADGGTLVVGDSAGKHLYTYRVKQDGTLDAKEKYYTLRTRPKEPSGVKALCIDDKARLYAATNLGVQVFDPTGRMSGVMNSPLREPVTALAFAGEKRDLLYIVCGGKLWYRKTKAKGAWPPEKK